MLKVGLTGGIGSGKTTLSNYIRGKNIPVVDADVVSRQVLKLYPEINIEIRKEFGKKFFDENNELKRKEFGNYIFKDAVKRKKFESIIMPYIKSEIIKQMDYYNGKAQVCVLDAPTLIEQNFHKLMDYNVLVWTDRETQIKRVEERDKLTRNEVIDRIDSQISLDKKKSIVNFTIDSSGDFEKTQLQMDNVFNKIKEIQGSRA